MRKALTEAESVRQNDPLKAVEIAAQGLTELIGAVIDEPTASLTTEQIKSRLIQIQADSALSDECVKLLGEADRIRFGGGGQSVNDISRTVERFSKAADGLENLGGR